MARRGDLSRERGQAPLPGGNRSCECRITGQQTLGLAPFVALERTQHVFGGEQVAVRFVAHDARHPRRRIGFAGSGFHGTQRHAQSVREFAVRQAVNECHHHKPAPILLQFAQAAVQRRTLCCTDQSRERIGVFILAFIGFS